MLRRTFTSAVLPAAIVAAVALPGSADAARGRIQVKPLTTAVTTTASALTATATATAATATSTATTATTAAAVTTAAITNELTQTCTEPETFKAFKAFGDNADYAFAPGGSFENGTAGWSLDGASVVNGNDTSGVYSGSKALRISDGGRVVSPWFCVTPANPHFRYTTYGGEIEMEIDYRVFGESDIDDDLVGETNGGSKWAPSAKHELATEIPASKLAKGVLARIIFEAEDDVYVDNLLVDPYRRG